MRGAHSARSAVTRSEETLAQTTDPTAAVAARVSITGPLSRVPTVVVGGREAAVAVVIDGHRRRVVAGGSGAVLLLLLLLLVEVVLDEVVDL